MYVTNFKRMCVSRDLLHIGSQDKHTDRYKKYFVTMNRNIFYNVVKLLEACPKDGQQLYLKRFIITKYFRTHQCQVFNLYYLAFRCNFSAKFSTCCNNFIVHFGLF